MSEVSQWEQVGGAPAIAAVLDRFYEGVLAEPQLSGFFANVDVDDIKPHLAEVLQVVLGAPEAPTGIDLESYLTNAHVGLGVSAGDYALTGEVLVDVLGEFEVPAEIVATIVGALEAVQPFVVSV